MDNYSYKAYACADSLLEGSNITNISEDPWLYIACFNGPQTQDVGVAVIITVMNALILVTGLLGNIAVCIVIINQPTLHTATNYYLFNLAVSDVTLLIFGLPNDVAMYWYQYPWPLGEFFCKARALVSETASNVSVLTVVAFSMERYIAICYPLYLRAISGLQRAIWIIACLWIACFICALPFGILTEVKYVFYPYNSTFTLKESAMCSMAPPSQFPLTELSSLIFFVVPMVIIAVLYINMGITIAKASKTKLESKMKGSIHRKSKRHQSNKSIIRMLSLVVLGFFICWAPYHAQRILTRYFRNNDDLDDVNYWLFFASGLCYYFTSTLNPILYNLMSEKMRNAFKEVFCGMKPQCSSKRGTCRETSHTYVSIHNKNNQCLDENEEDLFITKDSTSTLLDSCRNGKSYVQSGSIKNKIPNETGV